MMMAGGLTWLYETAFGWVLSCLVATVQQCGEWNIVASESLTTSKWMNSSNLKRSKQEDEVKCEKHFQNTHRR